MEEIIFVFGGILFILVILVLLKKIKRRKDKRKLFFVIKKVTTCKDSICHDTYKIQGIPDKEFKTYEDAERYALFLKEGENQ